MELVDPPPGGRVFRHTVRAGLADVAPSGRARLDAVARWLQDAAWADVLDSGIEDDAVWIVRRMHLRVARFPRFGDELDVATFCSGTGSLWAERRSTVADAAGPAIEAAALWVHLDARGARPRPLPAGFEAVYGRAAGGRRVRARLQHPADPPDGAERRPWRFRAADLDLAGHVNNAAYWEAVEEELLGTDGLQGLVAEIEHRAPGDPGAGAVLRAGDMRWIAADDGAVLATLRLSPRAPAAARPA